MPLVKNTVYVDGRRRTDPPSLDETFEAVRGHGGMAWIGLYRPTADELDAVAAELSLHPLAVEDTVKAHQRPKLERYGDVLFTVLRPARYDDVLEEVELGEVHVFTGPDFVVTVRHAESPDLGLVRARLEADPERLGRGPAAVLHAVLDQVVDEYAPVVAGLEDDVDEIEDELFSGSRRVSRRIYELFGEVIAFQRATEPVVGMVAALRSEAGRDGFDDELLRGLRDVEDHVVRVVERVAGLRALLQNALLVHGAVVAERQNEEMRAMSEAGLRQNEEVKKISAWAAILFAPTLVGTVYGMNFTHMPELDWRWGYPLAIGLMLTGSVVLWAVFRARRWL